MTKHQSVQITGAAATAYGVGFPGDIQPYDPEYTPVTIPSPPSVRWETGEIFQDPFDFLRPLLAICDNAQTACRLWARYGDAAIAIVGLAKLHKCTPDRLISDVNSFDAAIDKLRDAVKK